MNTVRQLVRLAVTQLRTIEQLHEAGRHAEVAEQWKALRTTMVKLLEGLGLKKGE
jgi:hypothetical protein